MFCAPFYLTVAISMIQNPGVEHPGTTAAQMETVHRKRRGEQWLYMPAVSGRLGLRQGDQWYSIPEERTEFNV